MTLEKKLIGNDEERAVSPVIGVILMVAITVILAAVIAAFVLDLGDTSATPQASFDVEEADGDEWDVTVTNIDRLDGFGATCDNEPASDVDDGGDDWKDDPSVGDSVTTETCEDDDDEEDITIYGEYDGEYATMS